MIAVDLNAFKESLTRSIEDDLQKEAFANQEVHEALLNLEAVIIRQCGSGTGVPKEIATCLSSYQHTLVVKTLVMVASKALEFLVLAQHQGGEEVN